MDRQPIQGKGKKYVDRKEDGEMTSGFMQEQHGQELHEIDVKTFT